jgi:hypothetical protein
MTRFSRAEADFSREDARQAMRTRWHPCAGSLGGRTLGHHGQEVRTEARWIRSNLQ